MADGDRNEWTAAPVEKIANRQARAGQHRPAQAPRFVRRDSVCSQVCPSASAPGSWPRNGALALQRAVEGGPAGQDLATNRRDHRDSGDDDQTGDQGVLENFATLLVLQQIPKSLHDRLLTESHNPK